MPPDSTPVGAGPGGAPAMDPATGRSAVAHSEQNLAVGLLAVEQLGQTTASGVAHSVQNFAPGRFSVPQFEQITIGG